MKSCPDQQASGSYCARLYHELLPPPPPPDCLGALYLRHTGNPVGSFAHVWLMNLWVKPGRFICLGHAAMPFLRRAHGSAALHTSDSALGDFRPPPNTGRTDQRGSAQCHSMMESG